MFLLIVSLFGFHGVIEQDTTWSDTAYLTGDVWVNTDVTLTINPGTVVLYADSCEWDTAWSRAGLYRPKSIEEWIDVIVEGNMKAIGDLEDSIWFGDGGGKAGNLILADDVDSLKYVSIEVGRADDFFCIGTGLVNATVSISHCVFEGGYGIVGNQSVLTMDNSELRDLTGRSYISDAGTGHIIDFDEGKLFIEKSYVMDGKEMFGPAIYGNDLDSCIVNKTVIEGMWGFDAPTWLVPNSGGDAGGFYLINCQYIEIVDCTFSAIGGGSGTSSAGNGLKGGDGFGIRLRDCPHIYIEGNQFSDIYGGSGGSGSESQGADGWGRAVYCFNANPQIVNNEFVYAENDYIYISAESQPVIGGEPGKENRFLEPLNINSFVICNESSNDIDATYNYWETGLDMIDSLIFDYYDDASKGIVHYDHATDVEEPGQENPVLTCQILNSVLSVNFNEPLSDPVRLNLYDVAGRNAYSTTLTERQTFHDLSGLSRGIYFVSVRSENNQLLRKRLVLR